MSIPVINVPGIGPKTAELLSQNDINTVSALATTGIDKLTAIPGINEIKARAFIEAAKILLAESSTKGMANSVENIEPVANLSQAELATGKQEKKHKKDKKNKKSKHKKPKDKKDDKDKKDKKGKDKKSRDKKVKDKKTKDKKSDRKK